MPDEEKSKRVRGVIDRVEDGGTAIVLIGEDERIKVELPTELLPAGAADGDHLSITVTLDKKSRRKAEEEIAALQEKLERRAGGEGQKEFKL